MQDLTRGSIPRHILSMAMFIGIALVFQAAYVLVDLYFVANLGKQVMAGVGAAANISMLVMAGSQLISVGALSLIAQASGRRDSESGNLVFNQAFALALAAAAAALLLGAIFGGKLIAAVSSDAPTAAAGSAYLAWFLPGLCLMFPNSVFGAGLRATGVVQPTMIVQIASVVLNAVLAPVLIAGWGTGYAMGAPGAGLASTIANVTGFIALLIMLPRVQKLLHLRARLCVPHMETWRRLVAIGLPATGDFIMMFVIVAVVYRVIRFFGPAAQAGYGTGSRVMQSIFLPAMAVSFAAAPVAGQNFGAGNFARVRATFRHTAIIGVSIMLTLTALCQIRPDLLVAPFTPDPTVAENAVTYLRIMSWNFAGSGLIFACSGMFQGLGDTRPSFISSSSRILTFVIPAFWLAAQPGARLSWIWHLSVASVALQAIISLALLHRTFGRKLGSGERKAGALPLDPAVRSTPSRDGDSSPDPAPL